MSLDGNGTYDPPAPQFPAIPDTVISSDDFNQIILDIAEAISTAIFRDGQAAFTANQSLGGFKIVSLGNGTNPGDAVNVLQVFTNPTFNGTDADGVTVTGTRLTVQTTDVILPATVTIGTRDFNTLTPTITELNFVDGVTSSIQTQIDNEVAARISNDALKANLAGGNTFSGTQNFPADTLGVTAIAGDQSTKFSTTQFVANAVAAAIASIGYTDVVFITAADSPYTVDNTSTGKLVIADTSAGNVVITLSAIAGLTLPFLVGVKKSSNDANTVTVNCSGTDVFDDGTASKALTTPSGFTLVPDIDPANDTWTAINFGGITAGSITGSGLTMSTGKMLGRNSPGSGAVEEIAQATQAEMEAGVVTALRGMTPEGVKQAIASIAPGYVVQNQLPLLALGLI